MSSIKYQAISKARAPTILMDLKAETYLHPAANATIPFALKACENSLIGDVTTGNVGTNPTFQAAALDFLACIKALLKAKATMFRYDNKTCSVNYVLPGHSENARVLKGPLWFEAPTIRFQANISTIASQLNPMAASFTNESNPSQLTNINHQFMAAEEDRNTATTTHHQTTSSSPESTSSSTTSTGDTNSSSSASTNSLSFGPRTPPKESYSCSSPWKSLHSLTIPIPTFYKSIAERHHDFLKLVAKTVGCATDDEQFEEFVIYLEDAGIDTNDIGLVMLWLEVQAEGRMNKKIAQQLETVGLIAKKLVEDQEAEMERNHRIMMAAKEYESTEFHDLDLNAIPVGIEAAIKMLEDFDATIEMDFL
jgi:hypothetical protein